MIGECLAAGFPENGRQLVDVLAANAVENARLALVPLEHLLHLAHEIQARENAIIEIRPVEIADENGRVLEPELLADIAPDLLGGGGGVSMEGDVRELLGKLSNWRYSGRKSWPQWLMQWASSMAIVWISSRPKKMRKSGTASRSGDTNSRRYLPCCKSCMTASRSETDWELSSWMAGTPASLSPSTWSFMSEISGEITTVVPPRSTAGAW